MANMETPHGKPLPAVPGNEPAQGNGRVRTLLVGLIVMLLLGGGAVWVWNQRTGQAAGTKPGSRGPGSFGPVPVVAGVVTSKDVPIYLDGLGTVQAFNTVTVRARVEGQIQKIAFVEGQDVRTGDLLAQIDPAPFQAQLDQSLAKQAQDQAQLAVARITLERNAILLGSKILSQQEYDAQKATVEQLAAAVQADEAAVNNARVQLSYCTIVSPLDGRTGIRLIDQGNMIHPGDSNSLVVITQLRPISVVFALPEQNLKQVQEQLSSSHELVVLAVDRDNRTTLDEGKLAVVDNQIDTTTGTIRLKATFPNSTFHLWPGQFVNARLLLTIRKNGIVVPASVVQRGPDGPYAFVIEKNLSVSMRPIQVAHVEQGEALINSGLKPGEQIVVDGQYKLQPGFQVKPSMPTLTNLTPQSDSAPPAGGGNGTQ